jgi:hypothetical protein
LIRCVATQIGPPSSDSSSYRPNRSRATRFTAPSPKSKSRRRPNQSRCRPSPNKIRALACHRRVGSSRWPYRVAPLRTAGEGYACSPTYCRHGLRAGGAAPLPAAGEASAHGAPAARRHHGLRAPVAAQFVERPSDSPRRRSNWSFSVQAAVAGSRGSRGERTTSEGARDGKRRRGTGTNSSDHFCGESLS